MTYIPETYSLFLELTRIVIAGCMFVYLFTMFDNVSQAEHSTKSDSANIRAWFSFNSAIFCATYLAMTYLKGSVIGTYLLRFLYVSGSLNMVLYYYLFEQKLESYSWLKPACWILFVLVSLSSFYAVAESLFLGGDPMSGFEPFETKNAVLQAIGNGTRLKASPLNMAPILLLQTLQVLVLGSMIALLRRGEIADKFITLGIVFSCFAMVEELVAMVLFPDFLVSLYFASNLPELVRVTIIARKRKAQEYIEAQAQLIKKEEQIKSDRMKSIASIVVTYNHHIRNPLTISTQALELYQIKPEPNLLDKARVANDRIIKILDKINDLTSQEDIPFTKYLESTGTDMLDIGKIE